MPMTWYTINQHQLFVETIGHGKNIITVHGGLGLDHTHYRPWLDPLAEHNMVTYYDQRGNGRSSRVLNEEITLDRLADDIQGLAQALKTQKPIVLAHSYGGFIGLNYAIRYPQNIAGLILINTCAYFDGVAAEKRMQNAGIPTALITEFNSHWGTDVNLKKHFDKIGYINFTPKNYALSKKVFGQSHFCAQARQRGFELLENYDYRPMLAKISTPTLIISGAKDILITPDMAKELADGIPNSECHIIPDCAHFPYVEQPKQFFKWVSDWLRRSQK